jgi:hypothetical protein
VPGSCKTRRVADVVRVTIVPSQGEADVICSLLRGYEIRCADRAADMSAERGGGFGGWREILVSPEDLDAARDLIAAKQAD